jgi:hypothetical protein
MFPGNLKLIYSIVLLKTEQKLMFIWCVFVLVDIFETPLYVLATNIANI